ncbi:sulfurtransferase [Arenibacter echinorum]|uniref:Thiosulfate/3-mercaptopyruvate sulfurtransferase n=1 Tax=Arenibacter echinorum TaxID=440515 RepID=A0A327RF84_9FLAO|nr:sulfurtransferase [Arenibacter echinorum]RAJ15361.1 thiosulfate/3-mercaptopyruvate sulfurtransferase [Arenibacter echinorum]
MNSNIVSVDWLNQNLEKPEIIILDVRLRYDPTSSELDDLRIKGARIFDLENDFSDKNSQFPNTLPSPGQFENSCRKLGINKSSIIVVYDHPGIYVSPRVWWMFKVMGHRNVRVLDGGFPEWKKAGYITEKVVGIKYETGNFKADFNPDMVVNFEGISENLKSRKALVIDARSSDRFHSLVPEPRKELRRGNIPNSINIPYETVLKDGKFKSPNELKEVFLELETERRPLVFSCGSGVTACIVLMASEMSLQNENKVYDGSWTEYAQVAD